MFNTNPFYGFLKTLLYFGSGRVKFDKEVVGKKIVMADKKEFTIFRRVVIKKGSSSLQKPKGLFIVRFAPTMEIKKNIRLSRIMLLIFMGFKGFRSKYWCVDEQSGLCQGVYEWESVADAERYSNSIAARNMTKRSLPGSVSFKVLTNTENNRQWQITDPGEDQRSQFRFRYGLN